MERVVLSTAAFCLWNIAPETKLSLCRELRFEHIQVALSTEKMVAHLLSCLEGTLSLKDFKSVTLHAPWCGVSYGDNERTKRILEGLQKITEQVPVKEVLFRVDCIKKLDVLLNSGLPVCLENSEKDAGLHRFKTIASESGLPLALNLNRAVRAGSDVASILKELGPRVSRILVSGFDREMGRMPLLESGQLELLEGMQNLNVPVVLEGLFHPGDKQGIEAEREAVWHCLSHINREKCTA